MESSRIKQIIERTGASSEPEIEFIKRMPVAGTRLGIFASSFNPITVAHFELIRLAASEFSLDETLALAGKANADKTGYECSLEDRLSMLALTFEDSARISIALSSHPYFVDMIEALGRFYPLQTDFHFIMGFDTFERVLDPYDKYTKLYHRKFDNRREALLYLLSNSRLIIAGRAGRKLNALRALLACEPEPVRKRISYLDLPGDLGDKSATEVRDRLHEGLSVSGLVPTPVERYIEEQKLYR